MQVKSLVYMPDASVYPHTLEAELRLYRLTGGKVVTKGKDLPQVRSGELVCTTGLVPARTKHSLPVS